MRQLCLIWGGGPRIAFCLQQSLGHWTCPIDRPDVSTRQGVQLTGADRPFGSTMYRHTRRPVEPRPGRSRPGESTLARTPSIHS